MTDLSDTTEKKSERLEVRLGYREKGAFVEACEMQGDTPSGAVRRFISGYVRRADGDVLASAWRGAVRRRVWPAVAVAGAAALLVGGVWWASTHYPLATDDEVFAARDRNGDGEWDISEHRLFNTPDEPQNAVLRVLDLDASGTISRAEFVREGRMLFAVEEADAPQAGERITPRFTLVEFAFTPETTRISTFTDARVDADGIDRAVYWPLEGPPTVLDGDVAVSSTDKMTVQADSVRVRRPMTMETGD